MILRMGAADYDLSKILFSCRLPVKTDKIDTTVCLIGLPLRLNYFPSKIIIYGIPD